jgi:hypothetical protein
MREIRRDPDYIDDPILLEYLQSVWQPLVAEARARGNITADIDPRFAWEPFLVRDPSINAFALPGGYMGVHLGLMAITATRDELASVLAHELSHITQRHIARSIASSKRQSLLSLASLVVGPARSEPEPQPGCGERRDRRHAGGDAAGAAQLLARHGTRGRPGRHGRDDRAPASRPAAWPRCSRSSTRGRASTTAAASLICAATRCRPSASAKRGRASAQVPSLRRRACSNTPWPRRARAS